MRILALVQLSAAATCPILLLTLNRVGSQPANPPLPLGSQEPTAATREGIKEGKLTTARSPSIARPESLSAPTYTSAVRSTRSRSTHRPQFSPSDRNVTQPSQAILPVPLMLASRPETMALPWDRIVARSVGSDPRSTVPARVPVAVRPQSPATASQSSTAKALKSPVTAQSQQANSKPSERQVAAQSPQAQPAQSPQPIEPFTQQQLGSTPKVKPIRSQLLLTQQATSTNPAQNKQLTEGAIDPFQPVQSSIQQRADKPSTVKPIPSQVMIVQQPAVVSPTQNTQLPEQAIDPSYVLGPGDSIQITVFNVPEYSGQQRILVDGAINLPAVGKLSLAGMNLQEAEAKIAARYASELRYPRISINLLQSRPLRVGIAGEVNQPGFYTLSGENAQLPTIAQAIQAAGGATQAANLRQIQIRRPHQGVVQTLTLNLWELAQTGDLSQNLSLRDGDSIAIPSTAAVNLAEAAQLAASNLATNANQVVNVALVGEVARPGAYKLGASGTTGGRTTLTQAIQQAGGITPLADLRQIQVRRMTRGGETQLLTLNLWQLIQAGDLSQDLILQQGDTVILPKSTGLTAAQTNQLASANLSPSTIRVNVIGEAKSPGATQLPSNTTLNQALLAAGGVSRRGSQKVELIRLNPDGTVTRQKIAVDLSRGIDPETNPVLWNNDVIVVPRTGFAKVTDAVSDTLEPIFRILPLKLLF